MQVVVHVVFGKGEMMLLPLEHDSIFCIRFYESMLLTCLIQFWFSLLDLQVVRSILSLCYLSSLFGVMESAACLFGKGVIVGYLVSHKM